MKAKISRIILWPKREGKLPRVIKFEMTGVEVITGKSQTGKSSLIPIVDYCLGSSKCAIPVGEIRKHAEWFGIIIKMPKLEMLLARRNPGAQAQTSEMYFDMSQNVLIPRSLDNMPSTNVEAVVAQLNQLAKLPSLSLTGGDEGGFSGRPSFRDTAAFQFQPQHVVANPYTLFFKADSVDHQDKLKNIFPLVLGAIDGPTLEKKRILRNLENELFHARNELETRRQRGLTWIAEFQIFYSQARALGLLPNAPNPSSEWDVHKYVDQLSSVPDFIKKNPFPKVERGASSRLVREINTLRDLEESTAKSISDRERKLARVERLRSSADGYSQALDVQGQRLQPLPWLSEHISSRHNCPVCGSESASAANEIHRLVDLAKNVALSLGSVESVNNVLDKEVVTLNEELQRLEGQANDVRQQLQELEQQSEAMRAQRQTINDIHTLGGRVSQELKKFEEADQGNTVVTKVKNLEEQVFRLRRELDQGAIKTRQEEALDVISKNIIYYAQILGVENSDQSVRIDVRNLTLAIKGEAGRQDYLWEIGSAANWMGYHLATLLALHEFFLAQGSSPVPQFIFFDQPSQAFFPERIKTEEDSEDNSKIELVSDDITRVQRIFRALSEAIKRTKRKLQIVVIEHVGEAYWKDISDVHVVERWRGDGALIPKDWKSET